MYSIVRFIVRIFVALAFSCKVNYQDEEIPEGKLLLCCNHTSIFDIVMVMAFFPHKLVFVAKEELASSFMGRFYKSLGTIFVDRGNMDVRALRAMLETLDEGKTLAIFPEGTRVKYVTPKNMKEGAGFLVQKSKCDTLCMHIEGEYKFRSKIKVDFRPILRYEDFQDYPKKEQRKLISHKIYNQIYNTDYKYEDFED